MLGSKKAGGLVKLHTLELQLHLVFLIYATCHRICVKWTGLTSSAQLGHGSWQLEEFESQPLEFHSDVGQNSNMDVVVGKQLLRIQFELQSTFHVISYYY